MKKVIITGVDHTGLVSSRLIEEQTVILNSKESKEMKENKKSTIGMVLALASIPEHIHTGFGESSKEFFKQFQTSKFDGRNSPPKSNKKRKKPKKLQS